MQGRTIAHNGSGWVIDAERPGSAVRDGKSKRARMASPFWLPQALADHVSGVASSSLRASSRCSFSLGRVCRAKAAISASSEREARSNSSMVCSWALTIERSEEHTSELQSRENLVCRLLLGRKKKHHGDDRGGDVNAPQVETGAAERGEPDASGR